MTVLEQKKFRLIRAIMNDTDADRVSRIERLYDENPLLYSAEELNESLCQIEKDFENGKMKSYSSTQMRKHAV